MHQTAKTYFDHADKHGCGCPWHPTSFYGDHGCPPEHEDAPRGMAHCEEAKRLWQLIPEEERRKYPAMGNTRG